MPRRGENIHKRADGRWEGRYIDYYKPDGKPHYKSIYRDSYTEVKNVMKSEEKPHNERKVQNVSNRDMKQVTDEWLESVKVKIKTSSYSTYYTDVQNHIIPYFKEVPFTNEALENFIKAKSSQEKPKLSAKTIRGIVSILLQIVKYAEKREYIEPFRIDLVLPKIQAKKPKVLTYEQQKKLVSYIQENLNKETLGILIALYTGVRLGELCSLTWGNVDFSAQELIIAKTVQRIKNFSAKPKTKTVIIIDKPKSEKSTRNIPLPVFLLEILKIYSENHNGNDYILTGTVRPIDPRTYQNKFKRHINLAGLNNINIHAIRHTFATRAIEVDFDTKSLSEILGHASVRFTLDQYVHSSQEQKKICMSKMAKCYWECRNFRVIGNSR